MNKTIPLSRLPAGRSARVVNITAKPEICLRLRELGLTNGTKITVRFRSMLGDPTAYEIRGVLLAIRKQDAKYILVEELL